MYITGWTVLLAALGAVPAALTQSRGVAVLWALGTLALAGIDALLAPPVTSIGVQRKVPRSVRLTESTASVVTVANLTTRRIRGSLRDAWPPSAGARANRHRMRIPAHQIQKFTTPLQPTRRGDRHSDVVTVRLEGPLHLAGRQRAIDARDVLRVLPEFRSRKHLATRLARLREIDGQTSVNLRGAGSEFDSLREYVVGDDVRTIDWRGTARRADVVVRTYRPERDRRVFILVDTSRLSAARVGDAPRLDASIEAALLLAALASRAGDRVQVVAFDRRERSRAMGTTSAIVMPALADALATAEPELVEPDWPGALRLIDERLSQRAMVLLLTTIDASTVDNGLLEAVGALARLHQVVVASVDDPDVAALANGRGDASAVFGAAAAERSRLEASAVAMRIRQLGAEVVRSVPDALAPDVADKYLELKAAGRL
ncbi:MAG TPA: DUF58 domain-containing protein [Demequinaceae bacterium]